MLLGFDAFDMAASLSQRPPSTRILATAANWSSLFVIHVEPPGDDAAQPGKVHLGLHGFIATYAGTTGIHLPIHFHHTKQLLYIPSHQILVLFLLTKQSSHVYKLSLSPIMETPILMASDDETNTFQYISATHSTLYIGGSEHTTCIPLTRSISALEPIYKLAPFTRIASGISHSLGLFNGCVFSWGSGLMGQLGHGVMSDTDVPTRIEFFDGIKVDAIAACDMGSLVLSNGSVYVFGQCLVGKFVVDNDEDENEQENWSLPRVLNIDIEYDTEDVSVQCGNHWVVVISRGKIVYAVNLTFQFEQNSKDIGFPLQSSSCLESVVWRGEHVNGCSGIAISLSESGEWIFIA